MIEKEILSKITQTTQNKNNTHEVQKFVSKKMMQLLTWEIDSIELNPNILNSFEEELKNNFEEKIIWQEKAKQALINAIINNLFSIRPKKGPLWVFFFTWPSWVGKTQIARVLAEILLWSEDYITKIDCEQYSESHTARNLFWSPKSYIWYEESTPLHDINLFKYYNLAKKYWTLHPQIKYYNNFSIILFDEIEKANPNIYQSLLSAIEDWKIQFPTWKEDNKNLTFSKETDLSNSIIIFTSNIWNKEIAKNKVWFIQTNNEDENKKAFKNSFEKHFSPEFIWRIDDFIPFENLTKKDIFNIIKNQIQNLNWYFWVSNWNISLYVENEVIQDIVEKSYSKKYWARPSINMFQNTVEKDINKIINSSQLDEIWDNNTYTFNIHVKLNKWNYIYLLEKEMLQTNKKLIKLFKKIEEKVKICFNSDENVWIDQINDLISKIKWINWNKTLINEILYEIYYQSIDYFYVIHEIDNYVYFNIYDPNDKEVFKNIWWRPIKQVIEKRLKFNKWNLNYKSENFKRLFLNILKTIEILNRNLISPMEAKIIILLIDYVKKNMLKLIE